MELNQTQIDHFLARKAKLDAEDRRLLGTRLDAGETNQSLRSLEYVRKSFYEKRYAEFMGRRLVPLDPDSALLPDWIDSHTFTEIKDVVAEAKVIEEFGNTVPTAEVNAVQQSAGVVRFVAGYNLAKWELDRMANGLVNTGNMKAWAARRAMEQRLDNFLLNGAPSLGTNAGGSFLAHPSIAVRGTTLSNWLTVPFSSFQTIIDELDSMRSQIYTNSNTVWGAPEGAMDLVLPHTVYSRFATPFQLGTGGPMTTILGIIKSSMPSIRQVSASIRATTAAPSNKGRVVLYPYDAQAISYTMVGDLLDLPLTTNQLGGYSKAYVSGYGGIRVQQPTSALYANLP